jgi:hypothetical protein
VSAVNIPESGFPPSWIIKPTLNGWTDNKTGLEWIRHFDKHTKQRTKGVYRMLILDGHESHVSAEFEQYCKENNIIPISMPPHSSHLLQPLDVALYSPLKRAYGDEINLFIRARDFSWPSSRSATTSPTSSGKTATTSGPDLARQLTTLDTSRN